MATLNGVRHARLRWGLALLGVVAITVAAGAVISNSDANKIESVVRAALTDTLDAATFKDPGWTKGEQAAEKTAAMQARVAERLAHHFTGEALAQFTRALDASVESSSKGDTLIATAGGVTKLEIAKLDLVAPGTAHVTGRVYAWVTHVTHDDSAAGKDSGRTEGWGGFEATVTLVDGTWLVSELDYWPEL